MRLIQHKREAFWFYRFLSLVYDRINPLFWTEAMRDESLELADLRDGLDVLDVGAGTGFTTEGIVARADSARVVMLDQSPHQLARSQRRRALERVDRVQGDAEALPFADESFDRYVSAGSVEYWPDPQRAVHEAARILRPGGRAVLIGPVPPAHRGAAFLARAWMLFPEEREYREWFAAAGFTQIVVRHVAPHWHRRGTYAVAIAGVRGKRPPGPAGAPAERVDESLSAGRRLLFAARFVAGSLAGALFIPVAAVLAWRRRR